MPLSFWIPLGLIMVVAGAILLFATKQKKIAKVIIGIGLAIVLNAHPDRIGAQLANVIRLWDNHDEQVKKNFRYYPLVYGDSLPGSNCGY